MKTLADLQAIRDSMKNTISTRESTGDDIRIIVGMATCGIAAGARPVMTALMEEVSVRKLPNIKIAQTGCLGMCKLEPIVEVLAPGKEKVTYVKVTPEIAKRIIAEHIVNGNIVRESVITNE